MEDTREVLLHRNHICHTFYGSLMDTGIAIVTHVVKRFSTELKGGIPLSIFTIYAEMHAPAQKYLDDIYLVKVLSPAALRNQQNEEPGVLMTHGRFWLDATQELVKVGDELEISISPAITSD
jgi:hypothetical protein